MKKIAAPFSILFATVLPAIAAAAPLAGDAAAGKSAFAQCAACHSITPGQNGFGPSLAGVVGRPVASATGYAYSSALRSAKGKLWTTALLETYLTNPNAMFPGNKMGIAVSNPKTRADVIAYLGQTKGK